MVRLGMGKWLQHYAWDGHKYVCEDDFREEEECLVYTFGVNTDASFEESMASIGNTTPSFLSTLQLQTKIWT